MKLTQKAVILLLVVSQLVLPGRVHGEAMSEQFSTTSPLQAGGGGEFVHGAKSGKLLMRILMFGALPVQGIHYVPEGTDLLFAILYAGGFTDASKVNGITIRRRNVRNLLDVDLGDLIEDGNEIPKMMDGDIVTVPYNWRRDIGTISLVTGFISSMTAFTLSIVALAK